MCSLEWDFDWAGTWPLIERSYKEVSSHNGCCLTLKPACLLILWCPTSLFGIFSCSPLDCLFKPGKEDVSSERAPTAQGLSSHTLTLQTGARVYSTGSGHQSFMQVKLKFVTAFLLNESSSVSLWEDGRPHSQHKSSSSSLLGDS